MERVRDLEARLAKVIHNSSNLPSSDRFKRQLLRTRRLRRKSGKQLVGHVGHPGETLQMVAEADTVVGHWPTVCSVCQDASPLNP